MIIATSIKSLWKSHGEELIKFYLSEKNKPLTHSQLELITVEKDVPFIDSNNKRYYRHPKKMGMCVARIGELQTFIQYLTKGLSAIEDEQIDKQMSVALEQGIRNPNTGAGAKIGALLQERELRRGKCFHAELLYNILAVQFIREDEEPTVYDREIQNEKVAEFKKDLTASRAHFFFRQPELMQLIDLSTSSPEDVMTSLKESAEMAKELQEKLALIKGYEPISKDLQKNGSPL